MIRFEHLYEAQKRAYLIADNQLALQAGWSEELLAQELAWLRDENFDLDLIGFDASELERLLAIADGEAATDETEDEVPDPPDDPVSRPGDLWILGNHRLLCGDATVLADVERVLGGQLADMCSHDLPTTSIMPTRRRTSSGARRLILNDKLGSGFEAFLYDACVNILERDQRCQLHLHELLRAAHATASICGGRRQMVDLCDLGQEHVHSRPRRLPTPV